MLRDVLIVHESRTIRKIVHNFLMCEFDDISTTEVETTLLGIEKMNSERFHVVISGKEMSEKSGYELYHEMERSSHNKETPFLLISSMGGKKYISEAYKHGIKRYLTMPFSVGVFSDIVNDKKEQDWIAKHNYYLLRRSPMNIQNLSYFIKLWHVMHLEEDISRFKFQDKVTAAKRVGDTIKFLEIHLTKIIH